MSEKNLKNQQGAANTWLMVVIIVLLVAIIGGMVYFFMMNKKENSSTNSNSAAAATNTDEEGDAEETADEEDGDTITNKKTAVLTNVKDGKGTGTATQFKVNGRYNLEITTTGLPEAADGFVYFAWVEKKIPLSRIEAGELDTDDKKEGVYTLAFDADSDYSTFREVYVTLEPKKEDDRTGTPGEKVLDGLFGL